ncbi:MAG TPA: Cof-type HAD-IIB family hydrolase [Pseudogracilibacillus sp.]|nr:Cof-type HAD-IIB family hydrolase [Pseudogracilibacillus sp.]
MVLTERYLIAIDLDGTLLQDNRQISEYSKEVIKELIEKGHHVVIATGRSNRMSILYYHELGLTTPLINSNGAVIHHPKDKSWGAYHYPLDMKTAKDIIEISASLQSKNLLAAVHDNVIVEHFDEHIIDFYESGNKDSGIVTIGSLKDKLIEDPTLMLVYPHIDQLDKLTDYLNVIHAEAIDHRNWGEPFHIIEIMNKSMNKAIALKKVADYYGVPRERIIAFGDESNDLHMLEYAGIGVAMENGVEAAKNVADQVTKSNEEDGVALFLAEYFNLKRTIEV